MNRGNTDYAKREADNPDEPRGPEVTGCDLRGCCEAASLCERRKRLLRRVGRGEREREREERSVAV